MKKLSAIALVLFAAFSLSACGMSSESCYDGIHVDACIGGGIGVSK